MILCTVCLGSVNFLICNFTGPSSNIWTLVVNVIGDIASCSANGVIIEENEAVFEKVCTK
jgi:hypothetical protein